MRVQLADDEFWGILNSPPLSHPDPKKEFAQFSLFPLKIGFDDKKRCPHTFVLF